MLDGVTVAESKAQKDELVLEGADIENVSQSGALVN
jgi:large subunit ribosomal protein L9e